MRKIVHSVFLLLLPLLLLSCSSFLGLFTGKDDTAKAAIPPRSTESTPISTSKPAASGEGTDTSASDFLRNPNEGKTAKDVSVYRTAAPHPIIKTVPAATKKNVFIQPEKNLDALVQYLLKDEKDPFVRVKILHDWIADNIAYDTDAFFSGNLGDTSYRGTLAKKKSVCEGYASLFLEMCTRAGIQSKKISGYARGYGFSPFTPENFSDSNHAWNGVFLDNFWYLVDVTWDAGHVNGKLFERNYSTKYLFLSPEYMIYTHVPEVPAWQLMDEILSPSVIKNLPQYRGEYFQAGLKPIMGLTKAIRPDYTLELSFPIPDGLRLHASLYGIGGEIIDDGCFIQTEVQTAHLYARFPEPGQWLLRLFTSQAGGGPYEFCLEIGIEASKGVALSYPVAYSPFTEDSLYLFSPLVNPLKVGDAVDFKLKAPGYQAVCLIADGNIMPLMDAGGGIFLGNFVIPKATKFGIYGKKNKNSSSFTGLIGYTVMP